MSYRAILAAILLGSTASIATAQTAPSATTTPTTTPMGASRSTASSDRYAAIQGAKVGIAQAIGVAEKKDGSGKAISAEFETQSGSDPAQYEIKVLYPDGKLVEHKVDATNASVIKSENQPFEKYFTRLKAADFQNAKASLTAAIEMAERQVGNGAKAVDVEVEKDGSAVLYEIELVTATGKHEVKVDANGQVFSK